MPQTYLDVVHFETYVSACATRAGVRVEWEDPDATPRTNGKVMYLPRIDSTTSNETLNKIRYILKHETSHIVYTDFEYYNKLRPQGLLMLILNCIEDNRIDYLNDMEYLGDRRISEEYAVIYAREVNERISKGGELSEQQQIILPLLAWDSHHRDWIPSAVLSGNEFEKGLSSISRVRFDNLMAGDYGSRLLNLRTSSVGGTDDAMSLAEDILRDIYGQNPEDYKDPEKEGEKKGKGEEGDGEPCDDGKEGEAGDGEGGDKPGEDKGSDKIINVSKLEKVLGDHVVARTGKHYIHKPTRGAYTIPATKDYLFVSWPINSSVHGRIGGYGYGRTDAAFIEDTLNNLAKPLSNKLRLRLQIRSQGRWENGKKRGSMHGGSLHRLVTSKGTELESKVFRKHIISDTLDTAVSLLIDCSGSMGGRKFDMACASAVTLGSALEPLHIHYTTNGFTNTSDGKEDPVIFHFKKWGDRVISSEMIKRFNYASACLANNTDGDAIAWASHDLMQRKEKRKILIVLSDGSPAGGYDRGDISSYTSQVITNIENAKHHEIHGVGILDRNVAMYYKNSVTINSIEQLPNAILSIIDKAV